jgi:hypothetical protein
MHLLQRQVPCGQCELSTHNRMASASVPQQHIAIMDGNDAKHSIFDGGSACDFACTLAFFKNVTQQGFNLGIDGCNAPCDSGWRSCWKTF